MEQKLPLSDKLPDILSTGIDQNGEPYTVVLAPIQHDILAPDQLQRIARLQNVLREVNPMTLDGWVDSFLRETNPEKEISIYESVAVVYLKLTLKPKLSLEEKKSLLAVICKMSFGIRFKDAKMRRPKGIPSASKVHKMYRKALKDGARP
jgi:hypothetical protein